jgi:hypothetical protein
MLCRSRDTQLSHLSSARTNKLSLARARARSLSRARIDHESSCDLEGVHIETAEDMFNINENTTR